MSGALFGVKFSENLIFFQWQIKPGNVRREIVHGGCVRVTILISAILVNTQTHAHTETDIQTDRQVLNGLRLYTTGSASPA